MDLMDVLPQYYHYWLNQHSKHPDPEVKGHLEEFAEWFDDYSPYDVDNLTE